MKVRRRVRMGPLYSLQAAGSSWIWPYSGRRPANIFGTETNGYQPILPAGPISGGRWQVGMSLLDCSEDIN